MYVTQSLSIHFSRPIHRVWALYFILLAPCFSAVSQDISVDAVNAPLEKILASFATTNRIDLVYAQRQVVDRYSTCKYEGLKVAAALLCILSEHNLKAVQIRRKQFVLIDADQQETPSLPETGTIHGFISDGVSKEVLIGAHIYLPQISVGATTNEAGYYAIPSMPIGKYQARVSFLGYGVLDTLLQISNDPNLLRLKRRSIEFQSAIVSTDRQSSVLAEPGVQLIPVERVSQLPGFPGEADLLQSLSWLPSIQKINTNQGGLVIRGGEPDQIQYLIDGAPVYHIWHAGGLLSIYQAEAFKDVRLYRGSFPAEHGGRLSGVFDAELKDGSLDKLTGMVGMGLLSTRLFLEGPITNKLSFMVSGRRSYLDWIIGRRHPVDDGITQDTMRTGVSLYDISTKLTWRLSNHQRLSLGVYGSSDILDIRLPADLSLVSITSSFLPLSNWLTPSELVLEFDTRWSNRLLSLRYQNLLSRQVFLTVTGYGTSYRAYERIFLRPTSTSSVNSTYELDILDVGIKFDIDYYYSLQHHIEAGISVAQRNFFSELDALVLRTQSISEDSQDQSEIGNTEIIVYVQDTWKPVSELQIQTGFRISELRGSTGIRVSPRIGLQYELEPATLRMAAGINVQYLHQVRDRYSVLYDLISYRWVPASRSVDPSASYQASVGASMTFGNYLNLALDLYIHSIYGFLLPRNEEQTKDGLLGPGIGLAAILGQYTRGRAIGYGSEVNLQYDRGVSKIWISYAAGRSHNRAPELGEDEFRPGRFDIPHRLQISYQYITRHWLFGVSGQWRNGYPITIPEARYSLQDPLSNKPEGFFYFPKINNGRLPMFINFGLQGGYKFKIRGVDFQVHMEINNLHFRRNLIGREFDPTLPQRTTSTSIYGLPPYPLLEITSIF